MLVGYYFTTENPFNIQVKMIFETRLITDRY
jgi:hypothetical protein